ncbi:MAG: FliH/SctL family protein [Symbiobacteriia bacterium]
MSRVIKGYRVENQLQSTPAGPAWPAASVVPAHGRVPRERVQIVSLAAAGIGAGTLGPVSATQTAVVQAASSPGVQEQIDLVMARTQAKADLMMRQAEEKADLLIDRAMAGAQSIIDEARQAARDEGYREGLAKGQQEAEELRREAAAIRAETEAEQERLFADSREKVVELALTVARQLTRQAFGQDPELLLPLVDEALSHVHGEETATLRLAPAAATALAPQRDALASRHGLGDLRLVGDAGLPPGDLQVNTLSGSVDVQVDRQLSTLRGNLAEVVRHG